MPAKIAIKVCQVEHLPAEAKAKAGSRDPLKAPSFRGTRNLFLGDALVPENRSFVPQDDSSLFLFSASRSFLQIFILLSLLIIFSSCKNDFSEKQIKTLDSLSGALNQKLNELKQVDTAILKKAIAKYDNYKQFIQQNVNDTVSKTEADHIQQFFVCGKNLFDFAENRRSILARGSLINSQLNKLMLDAKENSLEEEKLIEFSTQEKNNAEQLIKNSYGQQQLFQANLQEFKLSLSGVEALIRARNNGQMPTIIKDSIPL